MESGNPLRSGKVISQELWEQKKSSFEQAKQNSSVAAAAMQLHRHLGMFYNAAWRLKHKPMQVMLERDDEQQLSGFIELDDAYLGGERSGEPGRGAAGKTPFVAAVETAREGHPTRIPPDKG